MKEYKRDYPQFSLCGLNCGLCPRYYTSGSSKCPGCGGQDFHLKHPSCSVITCNSKHDNVEYCYQCSSYPCDNYSRLHETDSFISYRNVTSDFARVKSEGIEAYQKQLNERIEILQYLIENLNDGKRKSFYCNAVNLLKLKDLKVGMEYINDKILTADINHKDKVRGTVQLLEDIAQKEGIELEFLKNMK